MPLRDHAAVRGAVKVGFSPVPGSVEADGPPKRSRVPKAETEDESDCRCGKESDGGFAGIASVDGAKGGGKDDRSPPEPDAASQRVLQVAAQQRLLEDCDEDECNSPRCRIFPGKEAAQ